MKLPAALALLLVGAAPAFGQSAGIGQPPPDLGCGTGAIKMPDGKCLQVLENNMAVTSETWVVSPLHIGDHIPLVTGCPVGQIMIVSAAEMLECARPSMPPPGCKLLEANNWGDKTIYRIECPTGDSK